jgi:hypothetical protein
VVVVTYVFCSSVVRDNAYHTMTREIESERLFPSDIVSLMLVPLGSCNTLFQSVMTIRLLIKRRLITPSNTFILEQYHSQAVSAALRIAKLSDE